MVVRVILRRTGNIGEDVNAFKARAFAGVEETADFFLDRVKDDILNSPKSGRMYGSHQASAPGEAPANWTGDLEKSLNKSILSRSVYKYKVKVSSGIFYAPLLEGGTNRVAARPFFYKWSQSAIEFLRGRISR